MVNDSFELIRKLKNFQIVLEEREMSLGSFFPTVVVVGPQSCGKSSLLSHLFGLNILPIGPTLTTKCPILIDFFRSEEVYWMVNEKTFKKISKVKTEIQKLTDVIGNTLDDEFIYIKQYGNVEVEMRVIDLPGIINFSKYDQPNEINITSENIIRNYIKQDDVLILAAIDGSVDICNSDGLALAKTVDPNFNRTIGVVTKLDHVDSFLYLLNLMTNKYIYLNLGYSCLIFSDEGYLNSEELQNFENEFMQRNSCYTRFKKKFGVEMLRRKIFEYFLERANKRCKNKIQKLEKN